MLESLRAWSAPYGGDLFLWVATLSLISYIALWWFKFRLSTSQLRRVIRLSALVALPLSWLAIQQGENHLAAAILPLVWCVVLGITCAREMSRRN
ncbi:MULTISPECIES: hypothetical protein [Delftia]|uniref:hypothetical protein n=1 Tax=Delftia TaxID=80865 RepID=UPI0002F3A51F|nr:MULTISPECIES: hypothetical protein [Delftia]